CGRVRDSAAGGRLLRIDTLILPLTDCRDVTDLSSLPERPLTDAEVSILNRSEPVTLAVAVDTDGETDAESGPDSAAETDSEAETRGILLGTDEWVRGIAFTDGAWRAVATESVDESDERYEALQQCESAVRTALAD
ncbi:MAG: hypothetical protein ABEI99_01945, partial [Halobaculum sp.]